jgi:hypothetical protein
MALKATFALESTTEEVCREGRRCTSREPSNPHKPITTHALYVLCANHPRRPGIQEIQRPHEYPNSIELGRHAPLHATTITLPFRISFQLPQEVAFSTEHACIAWTLTTTAASGRRKTNVVTFAHAVVFRIAAAEFPPIRPNEQRMYQRTPRIPTERELSGKTVVDAQERSNRRDFRGTPGSEPDCACLLPFHPRMNQESTRTI